MSVELWEQLEEKIGHLIDKHQALQRENAALHEENQRLRTEREIFKARIDEILMKLEDV